MIRIGPFTIMRTSTAKAYSNVVQAAWPVHNEIWFYGENISWPEGLKNLPVLDAELSAALSYAPIADAPK
jgi:hypothetical protein